MNPRLLFIGAAVAALGAVGAIAAVAAEPDRPHDRREMHRMEISRIDANGDGFIGRAEAQAEAERVFAELDDNHDGKLDASDRGPGGGHFMHREMRRGGHGHGRRIEEETTIERDGPPPPGDGAKEVIVRREIRDGHGHGRGHGPHGGPGGHPPMFMMIYANSGEADRNGDGALSKEEFVAQQLRFFDASDANGDGKIKFDPPAMAEPPEPPAPPAAPVPPAPPQPPRR